MSPDDALTQASAILQHHLDVFVGYDKNASNSRKPPTSRTRRRPR
jgi:DNA-directed RNA polymerase alpha subunit